MPVLIKRFELPWWLGLRVAAVVVIMAEAGPVYGQTPDNYLALLQQLAANPARYGFRTVYDETERFLRAYPLHDSSSVVALMMASAALVAAEDPAEALVEMAKAAQLHGIPSDKALWMSTVKRLAERIDKYVLAVQLDEAQVETLRELALKTRYEGPKFRRAFNFVAALYRVRSKKLANLLTKELQWYLRVFPASTCADTVRYWVANVLSETGQHELAASHFVAIAILYPNSPYAPDAILTASDELCKRPLWRFSEAAELLQNYLQRFDARFRRAALERLVVLMEDKLHRVPEAGRYLLELAEEFPQDFVLPEKTFRKTLEPQLLATQDPRVRAAIERYVRLYPDAKLARRLGRQFGF